MDRRGIFFVLMAFGTSAAWAGGMSTTPSAANDAEFRKLDTNSDHSLTQEEAALNPAVSGQWQQLDANANGQIEEMEFAKFEVSAPETAVDSTASEPSSSDMTQGDSATPAASTSPSAPDQTPAAPAPAVAPTTP